MNKLDHPILIISFLLLSLMLGMFCLQTFEQNKRERKMLKELYYDMHGIKSFLNIQISSDKKGNIYIDKWDEDYPIWKDSKSIKEVIEKLIEKRKIKNRLGYKDYERD